MDHLRRFSFTFAEEDEPEHLVVINTAVDHQSVALLEDMERNYDIGKKDEVG
jgi:hypothetical protein